MQFEKSLKRKASLLRCINTMNHVPLERIINKYPLTKYLRVNFLIYDNRLFIVIFNNLNSMLVEYKWLLLAPNNDTSVYFEVCTVYREFETGARGNG